MKWRWVQRHFPFLLGRLPRMALATPGSLVAFGERFAVELALAIPFVALLIATIVSDWGFFQVSAVVSAAVVLPLAYLVLLLMVRQHQGRRS
jgi:hypothetical protein